MAQIAVMSEEEYLRFCPHLALEVEQVGISFFSWGESDDDFRELAHCPECGLEIDYFRWPYDNHSGEMPDTDFYMENPHLLPTSEGGEDEYVP